MSELQRLRDLQARVMTRRKENELSHNTLMSTGEALRLSYARDIPEKAGSSNLNPIKAEEVK
jgi:hypothetical protein